MRVANFMGQRLHSRMKPQRPPHTCADALHSRAPSKLPQIPAPCSRTSSGSTVSYTQSLDNKVQPLLPIWPTASPFTSRGSTVSCTLMPEVTRSSTIRQRWPGWNAPSIAFLVP